MVNLKSLLSFGTWLSDNNFTRSTHSNCWISNCHSFGSRTDIEILNMYLSNPNELRDYIVNLHKELIK